MARRTHTETHTHAHMHARAGGGVSIVFGNAEVPVTKKRMGTRSDETARGNI